MIQRKKAFESREMYLESILVLEDRMKLVRAKDIAEYMGFTKASVSRALASLAADGLTEKDANDFVHLTESGAETARKVYERHKVLKVFLESIGIDSVVAEADACRIEHVISDLSFEKIREYVSRL